MGHVIDVSHLLLYSPLSQPAFHSLFIPISKLLSRRNLCNLRFHKLFDSKEFIDRIRV